MHQRLVHLIIQEFFWTEGTRSCPSVVMKRVYKNEKMTLVNKECSMAFLFKNFATSLHRDSRTKYALFW